MQLYKVIDYKCGHYIVNYYSSMYDINPVVVKVGRYRFDKWASGKLDKSELEGNKVKPWELRAKAKSELVKNTLPITISEKEKEIMDYIYKQIQRNNYIIEKDIEIDNYSKALVQRTVRNKNILDKYNLRRIRANKEVKEEISGIDIKSYPFIIVRSDKIGK